MWNGLRAMSSLLNRESKIIIINLGFNDKIPIRKWPMEHYLELIHRILEKQDTFIVLIGAGSLNASPFFSQYERCINLTGKTTIKELLALFSIASVLISYDCGILHIASTTNIYIIALFGPETPLLYGPLTENKKIFYKNFSCSPCLSAYNHRNSICKNNKCMQAITVDEIYNEVIKEIK